jgi:hypothetical protein
MLEKVRRWETFKKKRAIAVDRYIKQKKKCFLASLILKIISLKMFLDTLKFMLNLAVRHKEKKIKSKFMYLVISNRWIKNRKRRPNRTINLLKNIFSVGSNWVMDGVETRSKILLKNFVLEIVGTHILIQKTYGFLQKIFLIQKKLKDQKISKLAKVEVLENYWTKLYGQLQLKATKLNHTEAREFCKLII